jgi:hypothetical protein
VAAPMPCEAPVTTATLVMMLLQAEVNVIRLR